MNILKKLAKNQKNSLNTAVDKKNIKDLEESRNYYNESFIPIKEDIDSITKDEVILRLKKEILSELDKKLKEQLENYIKEHFTVAHE